jgi:hypothetical protein
MNIAKTTLVRMSKSKKAESPFMKCFLQDKWNSDDRFTHVITFQIKGSKKEWNRVGLQQVYLDRMEIMCKQCKSVFVKLCVCTQHARRGLQLTPPHAYRFKGV